jgi:hypothetical protein
MHSDAPPPPYYAPPPAGYCQARAGAPVPCGALLPPAPQRWLERPRWGLIGAGLGVGGGLAMINLITAASIPSVDDSATVWPLYVPVLGPFLQMGYVEGGQRAVLAASGVAQLGGLALIIAGAVAKRKIAVYGERLTLGAAPAPGGGSLVASLRFR